ncbi:MAG: adenylosuccinate synthetase [Anaerolineaceae bacterium]|nr:adenylosuccinate synthetase [Anaerolineaceae bacterium]
MQAFIIVDLGFGDAGKGILTDFLVRKFNAGVVVRYNGGAQAGHNVISPDGRHHTFSQFGSGSFVPGVKTILSRDVIVHPTALLVEGDFLREKGVQDAFSRIKISDQALIITPYHQAANHLRELIRGDERHGSCGVGVGETVEDALINPQDCIRAGDLYAPAVLRRKLKTIREFKRHQLTGVLNSHKADGDFVRQWEIFENEDVIDNWLSAVARVAQYGLVVPDSKLREGMQRSETVIFEGAQGVLLDADAGFHPYTTWSNCTGENALELVAEMLPGFSPVQIGVLRSYAVRHGPGPLPTESEVLTSVISEHNRVNQWQGRVRYGWFDALLTRYALNTAGKMDGLFVTHLDVLSHLKTWHYCNGYEGQPCFDKPYIHTKTKDDVLVNFSLPRSLALEQREQFTQALSEVVPILGTCEPDETQVIEKIEFLLDQSVDMISRGPGAGDVEIINAYPH